MTVTPKPSDFNTELFNQARPNSQAGNTWRKFLRTVADAQRRQCMPLGPWLHPYTENRSRPTWVYHAETQQLFYRLQDNEYTECQPAGQYYLQPNIHTLHHRTPPPKAQAVAVAQTGQGIKVLLHLRHQEVVNEAPSTFQDFIKTLDPWEYQLLQTVTLNAEPNTTMEILNSEDEVYIASDGSVIEQTYGSFGFVISTVRTRFRLITGNGPVPGNKPSSQRAEAYGVLAAGRILLRLSEYTKTRLRPDLVHWIDNQGVIKRLNAMINTKVQVPMKHFKRTGMYYKKPPRLSNNWEGTATPLNGSKAIKTQPRHAGD